MTHRDDVLGVDATVAVRPPADARPLLSEADRILRALTASGYTDSHVETRHHRTRIAWDAPEVTEAGLRC